ncbi:hypothetical protein ABOONEI_2234 [Aciduliprofundum boonei T469]|nr:hypothetical protein ABOONEI_2234 [Aciduliprofundum boonei T469]
MKKKKLEILMEGVENYKNPKASLEQYFTPATIASDIMFLAYSLGDIEEKILADFGAGTGIFTIGACLLGARKIFSVEIDVGAIEILKKNLEKYKCSAEILNMNVEEFNSEVDTVVQNPPFGAQNRHADLPFLEKAMQVANVIYTLHNANTSEFIERKIFQNGWEITHRKFYDFSIPYMYGFHRKEEVRRRVVFYRIVRRRF